VSYVKKIRRLEKLSKQKELLELLFLYPQEYLQFSEDLNLVTFVYDILKRKGTKRKWNQQLVTSKSQIETITTALTRTIQIMAILKPSSLKDLGPENHALKGHTIITLRGSCEFRIKYTTQLFNLMG